MLFTEFRFIFFMLFVFIFYWSLKKNNARKVLLLLCSYIFYSAWDWRFLSLIIISTLLDYTTGLKIYTETNTRNRKLWLLLSISGNLGILGFFKYYNFFIDSLSKLFSLIGSTFLLNNIDIILPVGISFFTFQTLSYSIDIYYRKLKPTENLIDVALFVSFFPQLVAGPIVRAKDFLPQLSVLKNLNLQNLKFYLALFFIGFFKKAVVADNLAIVSDRFFANPEQYSVVSSYIAVISYAVQIYCDFSGYSDMAIACAGLLGYEICKNFDYPYFANNIQMFWRRWHISLSFWFRDYCYIPLGGRQKNRLLTYKNVVITMLLCGLWHGAAWNFVFWGGYHAISLVLYQELKRKPINSKTIQKFMLFLGPVFTFYWVCIGWVFFRAGDMNSSLSIVSSMILFKSNGYLNFWNGFIILLVMLLIFHLLFYKIDINRMLKKTNGFVAAFLFGLVFYLSIMFSQNTYKPFIYFQF